MCRMIFPTHVCADRCFGAYTCGNGTTFTVHFYTKNPGRVTLDLWWRLASINDRGNLSPENKLQLSYRWSEQDLRIVEEQSQHIPKAVYGCMSSALVAHSDETVIKTPKNHELTPEIMFAVWGYACDVPPHLWAPATRKVWRKVAKKQYVRLLD